MAGFAYQNFMLGWSPNLARSPGRAIYSALHLTAVRWFYMASTARVPAYSKMPQVRRNLMYLAVFSSTTCMSVGLCVLSLFARAATMHYRSLRSRWRYTFVDLLPSRDPKSIMFVLSDLGLQNRAWMMTSRIVFMSDMKSYLYISMSSLPPQAFKLRTVRSYVH